MRRRTFTAYLQAAREALLWKLDGLSEYDVRRPMVPTGTNLLGLIKHVASVAVGYFGDTSGRPSGERLPWFEDGAEPERGHVGYRGESRTDRRPVPTGLGAFRRHDRRARAGRLRSCAVVAGDRSEVTLHRILVHMIAETDRHAGHADVVRELIDGAAGLRDGTDDMASGDEAW